MFISVPQFKGTGHGGSKVKRQQEVEALVTAHPKSRNRKNEPGVVVHTFNPLISAPTKQR